MSALTVYVDDSGSGLDLPYFLLGGVAVNSIHDQSIERQAATFDRKSKPWGRAEFLRCATFVSQPGFYPFSAYVRLDPEIVTRAKTRVREAKEHRRRHGMPLDRKHNLPAQAQLYMSVAATAFAACAIVPVFSNQVVTSIAVVADRFTMKEEYRGFLRASLRRETGAALARTGRLGLSAAMCARWGEPTFDWRSGGPYLRLADGYCFIVQQALAGNADARDGLAHIEQLFIAQGRSPAGLRIDDTERVRAQMSRSFV